MHNTHLSAPQPICNGGVKKKKCKNSSRFFFLPSPVNYLQLSVRAAAHNPALPGPRLCNIKIKIMSGNINASQQASNIAGDPLALLSLQFCILIYTPHPLPPPRWVVMRKCTLVPLCRTGLSGRGFAPSCLNTNGSECFGSARCAGLLFITRCFPRRAGLPCFSFVSTTFKHFLGVESCRILLTTKNLVTYSKPNNVKHLFKYFSILPLMWQMTQYAWRRTLTLPCWSVPQPEIEASFTRLASQSQTTVSLEVTQRFPVTGPAQMVLISQSAL